MPYTARKQRNGYAIVNKKTGRVVGHSKTKAKAKRSINARNAGAHGWRGKGR